MEEKTKIQFEDFAKVELKVAQILAAERLEKSEKLLKLKVSLGSEERQILAGIGKHYNPDELVGRKIVVVANLEPRKMMGEESQGMLLAASDEANNLSLLSVQDFIPAGSRVG